MRYLGFRDHPLTLLFRNKAKIKTNSKIDALTVSVVFIKEEYGQVQDKAVVVDIGANIGVYSIFAASTTKNSVVYAYEPVPDSYHHLLENIRLNQFEDRIIPFNLAVYARKEKRKLFLGAQSPFNSLYGRAQGSNTLDVNCISLQDVFDDNHIRQCHMLKLDCEGAEFDILYNTPGEYLSRIKHIRFEYHHLQPKHNIKQLVAYLQNNHFSLTKFSPDSSFSGIVWLKRLE